MNSVYKNRFKLIAEKCIKREGIDELMLSLEKSDFFTAPASTKYHDAKEEGLCIHSIAVFDTLCIDLMDKYPIETIAIVSLFHDICKINFYKTEMRNAKNEKNQWVQVPYYTVDDTFPYGHGEKSVLMIMDKMKLNLDEMMAIRWHMGAYSGQQDWNTLSKVYELHPLALHLHIADMKATYLK